MTLRIALLSVVLFALSATTADSNPFREAFDAANAAYTAGEFARAELLCRKVMFASPKFTKARKLLDSVRVARVKALLAEFAETKTSWERTRASLLQQAYDLDPDNAEVKAHFAEMGYSFAYGSWRSADEIEMMGEPEKVQTDRRKELGLGEDFEIIATGLFRFFTNVDTRAARSTIEQMVNSNATHYEHYKKIMEPLGILEPVGIDIVLFDTREQYMRYTKAAGTAGLYIPAKGAGFFFRDAGFSFPTMLHEMTHQHNDKVLGARSHGWYEEGISEYFGSAFLTKKGKSMKLGVVDSSRLSTFLGSIGSSGGGYVPLAEFVHKEAELTAEFYSEAWALAYYLMEIHPYGRLILFDYLSSANGLAKRLEQPVVMDLGKVVEGYDTTLADFEKDMLKHYRRE